MHRGLMPTRVGLVFSIETQCKVNLKIKFLIKRGENSHINNSFSIVGAESYFSLSGIQPDVSEKGETKGSRKGGREQCAAHHDHIVF